MLLLSVKMFVFQVFVHLRPVYMEVGDPRKVR